jgi:outer membrane immunogenic protein
MRMRLLTLVAAVSLGAAMAQSASAADLSLPPPVYRAPPPTYFTWTGWYIGLNGGGGWGQTSHTATVNAIGLPPATTGNFNTNGGLANGSSVPKPISTGPISKAPSMAPSPSRAASRRSR